MDELADNKPAGEQLCPPTASPPSRRYATLWNLTFSYSGVVLALVRNLALVPLYLYYISLEEYGAWLATGGVIGYLGLVDFGLMGVLGQQTGVACGSRDRFRLQRLGGTGLVIACGLSLLAPLAGLAFSPFLAWVLHLSGPVAHRVTVCFLIVSASTGLGLIGQAASGVLKSLQRSFLCGLINTVADAASIVLTVVLVLRGQGLFAIAWGYLFRSVVVTVGTLAWIGWVWFVQLGLRLVWARSEAMSLLKLSTHQFAARLAGNLLFNTDPLVIAMLAGPEAAGLYVLTTRALDAVRMIVGQVAIAIGPALAHLHGEGRTDRFLEVTTAAIQATSLMAAVGVVGVMALNHPFVNLWVGSRMYAGNAVTVLMGIYMIGLMISGGVVYNALYAVGEIPRLSRIAWLEVLVKLPLLFALVYLFGIWGAAAATLTAGAVASNLPLIRLFIRKLKLTRAQLKAAGWCLVRAVVVSTLLSLVIGWALGPARSWPGLLTAAGVYLGLACAIFLVTDGKLFTILWTGQRRVQTVPLAGAREK